MSFFGRLYDLTWRRVRHLENDVRGVQDSKLATWYIRNRRARGEQAGTPTPVPPGRRTPTPAVKE